MVKYSRLPKKKENEKVEWWRGWLSTACVSPSSKRLCAAGLLLRVTRIIKNVKKTMDLVKLRTDYNMMICWLIRFALLCVTVTFS